LIPSNVEILGSACFFLLWITFINYIWIKFTLEANWTDRIFTYITSINFDSKHCWNSWLFMFCILWITFINHIWIKFTLDANWIEHIF
jgi:hypothetical protein